MKRLALLGSTGSIGTQVLEIVRRNPGEFQVVSLVCGSNKQLLDEQVKEFNPEYYGMGEEALSLAAQVDCDLVVNAVMGMRGFLPTLAAIECGHDIALANKETLVAGGEVVMKKAEEKGIKILPIDSEHSAIFQCLMGNEGKKIRRILLTASGGPFRGWTYDELKKVTPEMALKHPNWNMGQKITIDSATMMNKGLEIIEAKWLFDVPVEKIQVLVHPQSIVHSGVEFEDTAILAQLGTPDMKVPISLALGYPNRIDSPDESLDFFNKAGSLTFEEPDMETFRCLGIAMEAIKKGGVYPAIMNGANEVLVQSFLDGKIGFTDIPEMIDSIMKDASMDDIEYDPDPVAMIINADAWARERAKELTEKN